MDNKVAPAPPPPAVVAYPVVDPSGAYGGPPPAYPPQAYPPQQYPQQYPPQYPPQPGAYGAPAGYPPPPIQAFGAVPAYPAVYPQGQQGYPQPVVQPVSVVAVNIMPVVLEGFPINVRPPCSHRGPRNPFRPVRCRCERLKEVALACLAERPEGLEVRHLRVVRPRRLLQLRTRNGRGSPHHMVLHAHPRRADSRFVSPAHSCRSRPSAHLLSFPPLRTGRTIPRAQVA